VTAFEDNLQRHAVWRGGAPAAPAAAAVPSGFATLDRELPGGGWPAGALSEILCPADGLGELQLVMPALATLTAAGRRVAWLAPPYLPYAPALAAAGVRLELFTVVRAPGRRDALWAAEQVLRAGTCHALLAWLRDARYAELRRLAVAAQGANAVVALFRPPGAGREPSPAALRLALEWRGGQLAARILKRRGAPLAAPLGIALRRPARAVGRAAFPAPAVASARARACVA
jgi:cell division inhibitor SulA/protein ImuA